MLRYYRSILAKTSVLENNTTYSILFIISFGHFINDMLQAVVPSVYPIIKSAYSLSFSQVGLITLTYQLTASILQPLIGLYTDKKPKPYSLIFAMGSTLVGLVFVSFASSFYQILIAVIFIGIGSSIFHPESSRVAHLAGGSKKGLAQSIFQVGGNTGSALGPLLAALIVAPRGQFYIIWFAFAAMLGMFVLSFVTRWYQSHLHHRSTGPKTQVIQTSPFSAKRIAGAMIVLLILIFSKYFYMACMTSYYTFYLIDKFNVSVAQSQIYLFIFLGAVAVGTIAGGVFGDRYGRKLVIWISILGAAPFTLLLPHASLPMTLILSAIIGLIISSAFSAILVYATELIPGKVGLIAGLFFGLAFGMGGIGSAVLGILADRTSLNYVFNLCSFLPLIGILAVFLPSTRKKAANI